MAAMVEPLFYANACWVKNVLIRGLSQILSWSANDTGYVAEIFTCGRVGGYPEQEEGLIGEAD